MKLKDIVWILNHGLKNKTAFLHKFDDLETKVLIESILDSKFDSENLIENYTNYKTNQEISNFSKKKLRSAINNSPHNLRLIIQHLIDALIINFSFYQKKKCFVSDFDKSNLLRLDLFPIPYIEGYINFLYLYELRVRCFESISFEEWTELLDQLNLFLDKNGIFNPNIPDYKFNEDSFDKFSICEMEWNILFNNDYATSILNMLQSSDISNYLLDISLLLKGLIIMKTPDMKKTANLYLKHALITASQFKTGKSVLNQIEKKFNLKEVKLWVQVYCLIALSINSNKTKEAFFYLKNAHRLIKDNSIFTFLNKQIPLNIYILLSKFYMLIRQLESKTIQDMFLYKGYSDKSDALPLLITSTFEEIYNEILKNEKYLTDEECIFILKYITKYVDDLVINCPKIFSVKDLDETLWNNEVKRNSNISLPNTKDINSLFYNKKNLLLPVDYVFTYLIEEHLDVEYKYTLFEFHSDICWYNIIPDLLLKYSSSDNHLYNKGTQNGLYFTQFAKQLLEFIEIIYEIHSLENKLYIKKSEIAEMYLFISLYTYFGKEDISLSNEFIKLGLELLDSCSECFDVCSIQCILSYLNLIIKIRSFDEESNLEPFLSEIINYGKRSFCYICPRFDKMSFKRKLVNFALIQAYTLFNLFKKNFHGTNNQEIMLHLNFENSKNFNTNSNSVLEKNSLIYKYFQIVNKLKRDLN